MRLTARATRLAIERLEGGACALVVLPGLGVLRPSVRPHPELAQRVRAHEGVPVPIGKLVRLPVRRAGQIGVARVLVDPAEPEQAGGGEQVAARRPEHGQRLLQSRHCLLVVASKNAMMPRASSATLPAGAIEGEHQLPAKPLAEWMPCNERIELRNQLAVPTQAQPPLGAQLDRVQAHLLQPRRRHEGKRLRGEAGQRFAAPERERHLQPLLGLRKSARRQQRPPLHEQSLEPVGIDVLRVETQPVAAGPTLDQPALARRGKRLPQPRNVTLQRVSRRLR